jgi:Right handed beta helix region/Pectate lyase superfamily protein
VLVCAGGVVAAGLAGWVVVDHLASGDGATDGAAPTTATRQTTAPATTAPTPSSAPSTTAPTTPSFNVRDHGARGDGTTDDSAAVAATFAAALDASRRLNLGVDPATAATAPTVVFPAGRYPVPTLADVALDAPVALRGSEGAVVDGGPGRGSTAMFRALSAVDVEGLELLGGGCWVDLSGLGHDVALVRIAGCTFRGAGSPVDAWPGGGPLPHGPDRLVIEDNVVEGGASRDPEQATFGFGLQVQRWGEAVVRGNVLSGVYQHGLRIGHQEVADGRPYADRADLTCTGNSVTGVWGEDKANGIIIGATRVRVTGNSVEDVTSGRDERRGAGDTEGIYVKGDDITVSGNTLVDAGRSQAQITVKGTHALIEGNRVEVRVAETGGIRVEDLHTEVRGNEIIGIRPGQDAISVQDDPRDDTIVVADNVIRGGRPKQAIYVGRRARVEITGNQVLGAPTERAAIHVQTLGRGTVADVSVSGNLVDGAAGTDGVVVTARDANGRVDVVRVVDNEFRDVARAVSGVAYEGGVIGSIEMQRNRYDDVATPVEASEGVPVSRADD